MPTAMDVARYFLAALGSDEESDITNLKLQKLCAYAQGISLGLLSQPLFEEPIEAWTHGPVIPSVYYAFKENGGNPISPDGLSETYARAPFSPEQMFVLEAVKAWYGSVSAWTLRNRSHIDFPGEFGSKKIIQIGDIGAQFAGMPMLRKLKEYTPPEAASQTLPEEEFLHAVSA